MERYITIHGHFYQPPRENPWLEAIELQDSAYPYHDWNERISTECYAPNSASRILDSNHRIVQIVNNYSRISFNFGPTLLAWMTEGAPDVYNAILEADRESARLYGGHGSALAQAYNHMIMPLANSRDKYTQALWGLRDFERRFGRAPEGMWLPETAVDLESLEILARLGIQFTILSPHQASRVRPLGGRAWKDISGGRIDPSRAYRVRLPSGRSIAVFFYDGPISRAVAFENLLERGENLANRLAGAFSDARNWPQLIHIATDGETYGHHRRHADMALAYALHHIEKERLAVLTNYGQYLELYPPTHEVQIFENSSWSCIHGCERWIRHCGCCSGMKPGWSQAWREPLRKALDWLRDELSPLYERCAGELLADPWRARDEYIDVILDRSRENVNRFLARHARRELSDKDRTAALKLLELQRHAMLMYTSCGWFFDELSGIETVQVIQYAGRALQLAYQNGGADLEERFLQCLENARSNLPEIGDGRAIFEKFVRPAIVDLNKVGAHYAISSLFEPYGEDVTHIYSHMIEREDFGLLQEGRIRLALGRAKATSEITGESATISFGVVHLGDHNVSGGVREYQGQEAYGELKREISNVFNSGDVAELVRSVDRNFGSGIFSLRLLFRDEQRKIVRTILDNAMSEAASLYRDFYRQHISLVRFVADLGIPLPKRFQMAVDFTLSQELLNAFSSEEPDSQQIHSILEQARRTGVALDSVTIEFALRRTIERIARDFSANPADLTRIERLTRVTEIAGMLPFPVNLWLVENIYYNVTEEHYAKIRRRAAEADSDARAWLACAQVLAEKLRVRAFPAEAR